MANINIVTAPAFRDDHVAETVPTYQGKDGDGYDRCGSCHKEQEPVYRLGDDAARHFMWETYSCDRRTGGCGNSWARTSKQGLEHDHARGVNPHHGTTAAETGRVVLSLGSDAYRRGFDAIRNHGHPLADFASPYKQRAVA